MFDSFFKFRTWQRAIFPGGHPPSIVTASSLYDRVRDGNGWFPAALSPRELFVAKFHKSVNLTQDNPQVIR